MRRVSAFCAIALAAGCIAGAASPAVAQAGPPGEARLDARAARPPARITVTPGRRIVRECEAWYRLERRLAGDVMTPQMRCWWTYR